MNSGNRHEETGQLVRALVFVAALAATFLLPAPAHAQGEVNVNVQMPDVVALRYVTEVQLQLSGTGQISRMVGSAVASSDGRARVGMAFHVDSELAAAVASGTANSTLTARLGGVFSVIGTSGRGQMRVSTSVEQGIGTHADGASLRVTEAIAIVGTQQGPSVTFDAPGVATSISGGLGLAVDLTDARSAGWYQGVTVRLIVEQI